MKNPRSSGVMVAATQIAKTVGAFEAGKIDAAGAYAELHAATGALGAALPQWLNDPSVADGRTAHREARKAAAENRTTKS